MKMPEIPEPAAHLADGLPVFSEYQMVMFAKQYGRGWLEEAAQVCDRFQARDVGMKPAECAGAIRSMKETL